MCGLPTAARAPGVLVVSERVNHCPICGAYPGEPCKVPSEYDLGWTSVSWTHGAREVLS